MDYVYLAYIHGWHAGEPYSKLIAICSCEASAQGAIESYLGRNAKDEDGNKIQSTIKQEQVDNFTSSVMESL